jgi:hypothetical protein
MNAAPSEAAQAWLAVRRLAESHGWQVDLTPRGRTCCRKAGAVVYGPGHGPDLNAYRDLIWRLGHADGSMSVWQRQRP